MRAAVTLVALLAISACSSSSDSQMDVAGDADMSPVTPAPAPVLSAFGQSVADFEAEATEVGLFAANNSRFDAIPSGETAGSAEFAGFVNVDAGPTASISAPIELVADFTTSRISGEQTGAFVGVTADGTEETYAGEIDVTYGAVGARGVANNARIDIAGTMTTDDNTVAVDGEILGKFIGTPIVGARGETPVGAGMSVTLNGESVIGGSAGYAVTLQ